MIQMRRSTRRLWCLLTAVMVVCAFGSSAAAALPEPQAETCFLALSGDTLTIRQGGVQTGSFAVGGEGFDIAFYRYEPTGQLCARFTDQNGDERKIALGTNIQLALSGTFDTVTLNASLGDALFYLKSDARVETFAINFSGTAFIFGRAGQVMANGPAVVSLQGNAEVGRVSLNNRGAALHAASGANVTKVNRVTDADDRAESSSPSRSGDNRRPHDDDRRDEVNQRDEENYITGVSITGNAMVGETVKAQVLYTRPYGRVKYQWFVRTSGGMSALGGETNSSLYIDGTNVKVGDEVRVRVEGQGNTHGSFRSDWRAVQSSSTAKQVIISGDGTMTDRISDNVMYTITAQGVPDSTSLNIKWDPSEPAASINIDRFYSNKAWMSITANTETKPGTYSFIASVPGYLSARGTLTIGSSSAP